MVKTGGRAGLVPLFYKEVTLKKNASLLKLSPRSSKWSITPEFYKYIDEIFPIGDSRKMVDELFEMANIQLKNGNPLSGALFGGPRVGSPKRAGS